MKRIEAKIVADSISPQGHRITSMLITFPRFILAEGKTHRIISGLHGEVEVLEDISINSFREGSKNSASSRAIPFEKMVKMVEEDPFIPIAWQKDHRGMQGSEYFTDLNSITTARNSWVLAAKDAISNAKELNMEGVTKQLVNRLLEPFMWHTTLVTATEWENFFELRCPKYFFQPSNKHFRSRKDFIKEWNGTFKVGLDVSREANMDSWTFEEWQEKFNHSQAEIHIQVLAESMWDAMNESIPKQLKVGEWHIPKFR